MFASGVPPAWCSPMPTSPLTCLLLRWVPAHTGSATRIPAWGGLDPSCCVPCAGTLGAAAKAPQPVRHSCLPVQRAHFLGNRLSGSGAGLREEGVSGNAAFRVPGLQLLLPCIIFRQSCITLHHSFLLLSLCWAWWWWWPWPWWCLWPQRWWPWSWPQ